MNSKKLAAVDIGTNTFRLIIAEVALNSMSSTYTINEIYSERIITRLGEGIHQTRNLNNDAIERSIAALRRFCQAIALHDVSRVSAVATSALREAANSEHFLGELRKVTELPIEIISGEQEARLTAMGMLHEMRVPETSFMIDIGGGSTEFIFTRRGVPEFVRSLNTGVVYLAGKYMGTDPPLPDDLRKMKDEIFQDITACSQPFRESISGKTEMIGTAGTVTALASMAQKLHTYDHRKIHNYTLALAVINRIYAVISGLPSQERAGHIPFELSRLDIIVPGTLILSLTMEIFGFKEIRVSNYGLREGVLIDLYNSECQKEAAR